ncbi:hypothetical protein [Stieleria mannarensis]|uniref:hypothetical protein n=1 Tax=Stieleria mannarensis TaxID=2755585 RepID=UPI001600A0E0|nr:hypothetical protein [Rhodopirellula sp. JC639]
MSSESTQTAQRDTTQNRSEAAQIAADKLQQAGQHFVAEPAKDLLGVLRGYANDKPDVAAMWCFGLGLLVGWKLRG